MDRDDGSQRLIGSDAVVAEIGSLFQLGEIRSWWDLGGSRTTNLALQLDGAQVVARVHRVDTAVERLVAEQAARTALAKAGVPTVTPIPDRAGKPYRALH